MKFYHKIYIALACAVLLLWPVWEFGKVFFDWQYNNPVEYFRVREELKTHMEEKHPNQKYYIANSDYVGYMNGYEFLISIPEEPETIHEMVFFRRGYGFRCWIPEHDCAYPFKD